MLVDFLMVLGLLVGVVSWVVVSVLMLLCWF